MKIAVVSATSREILLIKEKAGELYPDTQQADLSFHTTGVGMLASCYSLIKIISALQPDLIIQAGIAGSFTSDPLGEVLVVKADIAGDMGVEENGMFKDVFDLGLAKKDVFPFTAGKLINPYLPDINILHYKETTALTINEITTRPARISQLKTKYQAGIESMEGASLHYCCLMAGVRFLQVRATSNYVGERNKSRWKFKEAFSNLAEAVLTYLEQLKTNPII